MPYQSPYADVIWTNYVPLSEDIPKIKDAIHQEEVNIRKLDAELAEIDRIIAALQLRRGDVDDERARSIDSVKRHISLLTPARALPLDILSQIFLTLAPSVTTTASKLALGRTFKRHPIVAITHVCRRWRDLAIGMCDLWTNISLCDIWNPRAPALLPNSNEGWIEEWEKTLNVKHLTEMVSTFISRAAGCPMILFVVSGDFEERYCPEYKAAVSSLVDAVKEARWENIEFSLQLETETSPLLRLLNVPTHSKDTLRCARLRLCSTKLSTPLPRAISNTVNLQRAAHLTSLDINIPGKYLHRIKVEWKAVRTLGVGPFERKRPVSDVYDFSPSHALAILARCPNLAHCRLRIYPLEPLSVSWNSSTTITLPHLHSLSIIGYPPPLAFADALNLPAIHSLSILDDAYWETRAAVGQEPYGVADSFLCALVLRYGTQLMDVTFDYGSLTQPALISCLEELKNVKSLTILPFPETATRQLQRRDWGNAAVFNRNLLQRMTPRFDGSGLEHVGFFLCPNLKRVSFSLGPMEANLEDWVDFVAARRTLRGSRDVAWLEKIRLKFGHEANEVLLKGMRRSLKQRGVDSAGIKFIVK